MAFLVVLESLTPAGRVALILHDVFGYPFTDVAQITGRTPAACRQLASAARRRIRAAQPPPAPPARQASLVRDFKHAWEAQDVSALIALLDPDATVIADGGGLASAALAPIGGAGQIARYITDLAARASGDMTILERTVNGQPGLIAQQDGVTVTVFAFDVADDRITRIWAVRNPQNSGPGRRAEAFARLRKAAALRAGCLLLARKPLPRRLASHPEGLSDPRPGRSQRPGLVHPPRQMLLHLYARGRYPGQAGQHLLDAGRMLPGREMGRRRGRSVNKLRAQGHAAIADEHPRPGHQPPYLGIWLQAERARRDGGLLGHRDITRPPCQATPDTVRQALTKLKTIMLIRGRALPSITGPGGATSRAVR